MDRDDYFYGFLLFVIVVLFAGYSIHKYLDTPEVYFSNKTKKCVKVVYSDGHAGNCQKLPKKYHHIWSE